jgi:hypothetical protein
MEPFTVALFKKTKYSDVDNWHVYNASKYLLIRVVCSSRLIISSREKSRVQHRPWTVTSKLLDWGSVRWTQRQPAWGQGNGNFQGLEQPHSQARVVSAITNEFVFTILIKDERLLIKKHCLFAWKSSMFVKSTNWQVLIWSANHMFNQLQAEPESGWANWNHQMIMIITKIELSR